MPEQVQNHSVCIAGGGPAGLMAGYLLARTGIDVVVLEKHSDFLRDFRGDTVHPSTLEVLHELGLLEEFLLEPHQKVHQMTAVMGEETVRLADFSHLPSTSKFIAFIPQWDFLDFLSRKARAFPNFRLIMQAEAKDLLIADDDTVIGVAADTPDGPLYIYAGLTIGADGRSSTMRSKADLAVTDEDVDIDVLWFRLSREAADGDDMQGIFRTGYMMVMINRGAYWQCAYVIPKNGAEGLREKGLDAFREQVSAATGIPPDRVEEISDWDQVKLLTVKIDHLDTWHRAGLLCIGDAAHAMSPVGGVGINLAIQDAVATANLLAPLIMSEECSPEDLDTVRKRRQFPARMTQRLQTFLHKQVIYRTLEQKGEFKAPWFLRVVTTVPFLRRMVGRAVGLGIRPEHIDPTSIPVSRKKAA
ncbi:MAG: hypothetical protein CMK07_12185 [Ponticaulis sp.]|nr:hypothetical protein [Ponticaulis sp.]